MKTSVRSRASHGERGQAIVLLALLLLTVLGFSALLIDIGYGYVARREQQNAADAAAVAASSLVLAGVSDGAQVHAEVDKYVRLNRGDPAQFSASYLNASGAAIGPVTTSGSVPGGTYGVMVVSRQTINGFFSAFLGRPIFGVAGRADTLIESAASPTSWTGLAPLAVPWDELHKPNPSATLMWGPSYAKHYNDAFPGRYNLPSNWKGILDLDGYSSHTVCNEGNKPKNAECWVDYGLDGKVDNNADVPTYGGDLGNNVAGALRRNIARQGLSDARGAYGIIYISVYDSFDSGNDTAHVCEFAAMKVYYDDVAGSSAPGTFVSFGLPAGGQAAAWGTPSPRVVRLVPPNTGTTVYPTPTPGGATPTPVPTATPTPTATPSCNLVTSGPFFTGSAQGSKKFDVTVSWASDELAAWVFEWGSPYVVKGSGAAATSGSLKVNGETNGTYNWRLTLTRPGCTASTQLTGTFKYP